MADDMAAAFARIELQNAEFKAVKRLAEAWRPLQMIAPVDDDYPEFRHRYEGAIEGLLRAARANGRSV